MKHSCIMKNVKYDITANNLELSRGCHLGDTMPGYKICTKYGFDILNGSYG